MRIIPAIDIIDGKCVRLTKGDYATQKTYNENPLEVAKMFEDAGIKYLHLVDLDGAKAKAVVNYRVLDKIVNQTGLIVDFGGGIKSLSDLEKVFDHGAAQVTCGSIAAQEPALFLEWLSMFGPEKIILGADAKNRKIATHGWLESSSLDVVDFISDYQSKGVCYTICTDIDKDGMMQGPSTDLYKEIIEISKVNLIASGGVTTMDDVMLMKDIGCEGAIIGKAIYEGTISLKELSLLC